MAHVPMYSNVSRWVFSDGSDHVWPQRDHLYANFRHSGDYIDHRAVHRRPSKRRYAPVQGLFIPPEAHMFANAYAYNSVPVVWPRDEAIRKHGWGERGSVRYAKYESLDPLHHYRHDYMPGHNLVYKPRSSHYHEPYDYPDETYIYHKDRFRRHQKGEGHHKHEAHKHQPKGEGEGHHKHEGHKHQHKDEGENHKHLTDEKHGKEMHDKKKHGDEVKHEPEKSGTYRINKKRKESAHSYENHTFEPDTHQETEVKATSSGEEDNTFSPLKSSSNKQIFFFRHMQAQKEAEARAKELSNAKRHASLQNYMLETDVGNEEESRAVLQNSLAFRKKARANLDIFKEVLLKKLEKEADANMTDADSTFFSEFDESVKVGRHEREGPDDDVFEEGLKEETNNIKSGTLRSYENEVSDKLKRNSYENEIILRRMPSGPFQPTQSDGVGAEREAAEGRKARRLSYENEISHKLKPESYENEEIIRRMPNRQFDDGTPSSYENEIERILTPGAYENEDIVRKMPNSPFDQPPRDMFEFSKPLFVDAGDFAALHKENGSLHSSIKDLLKEFDFDDTDKDNDVNEKLSLSKKQVHAEENIYSSLNEHAHDHTVSHHDLHLPANEPLEDYTVKQEEKQDTQRSGKSGQSSDIYLHPVCSHEKQNVQAQGMDSPAPRSRDIRFSHRCRSLSSLTSPIFENMPSMPNDGHLPVFSPASSDRSSDRHASVEGQGGEGKELFYAVTPALGSPASPDLGYEGDSEPPPTPHRFLPSPLTKTSQPYVNERSSGLDRASTSVLPPSPIKSRLVNTDWPQGEAMDQVDSSHFFESSGPLSSGYFSNSSQFPSGVLAGNVSSGSFQPNQQLVSESEPSSHQQYKSKSLATGNMDSGYGNRGPYLSQDASMTKQRLEIMPQTMFLPPAMFYPAMFSPLGNVSSSHPQVFMKEEFEHHLDIEARKLHTQAALNIQRFVLMYLARRRFLLVQEKTHRIQAAVRMHLAR